MSEGSRPNLGTVRLQGCPPLCAHAVPSGRTQGEPCAAVGVESSLRVTRCRQILQSLPEHNYAVLSYLMGFLHEVSGQSRPRGGGWVEGEAQIPCLAQGDPPARGAHAAQELGAPSQPRGLPGLTLPGRVRCASPAGPTRGLLIRPAGWGVPCSRIISCMACRWRGGRCVPRPGHRVQRGCEQPEQAFPVRGHECPGVAVTRGHGLGSGFKQ